MGAASGIQYDLHLAHDLSFLNDSECQRLEEQVIEVKRMLTSLIHKRRLIAQRGRRKAYLEEPFGCGRRPPCERLTEQHCRYLDTTQQLRYPGKRMHLPHDLISEGLKCLCAGAPDIQKRNL
jgi:hypothetical protein